jgi:hypothetical protein
MSPVGTGDDRRAHFLVMPLTQPLRATQSCTTGEQGRGEAHGVSIVSGWKDYVLYLVFHLCKIPYFTKRNMFYLSLNTLKNKNYRIN